MRKRTRGRQQFGPSLSSVKKIKGFWTNSLTPKGKPFCFGHPLMGTDSKYWEIYAFTREEWVWTPQKDYILLDPPKISIFATWDPVLVPTQAFIYFLSPLLFITQTWLCILWHFYIYTSTSNFHLWYWK